MRRQWILMCLALLLLSSYSYGQCTAGDCLNGYGTYKYSDGSVYVGEFQDGKANGFGTCYYANGDKYAGYWKSHKAEGQGTMYYKDGRVTTGTWKESKLVTDQDNRTGCISGDCLNGMGTYAYDNGTKYSGTFVNGAIHGYGTCSFYNGDKYEGNWENNQMSGEGTYTYTNGKVESGMWKDNKYIGPIVAKKGCISGDCDNGFGTFIYDDGSKYTGNFIDSKANGSGTCTYANGNKFVGEFANHTYNGYGTMYYKDGRTETGTWKDGKLVDYVYSNASDSESSNVTKNTDAIAANTRPEKGSQSSNVLANVEVNKNDNVVDKGSYDGGPDSDKSASIPNTNPTYTANSLPKVWAVVVGIATYEVPKFKLNYPDDDAYRIYSFLKSPEGGALPDKQIALLIDEDATKENIIQSLKDIFGQAGPNDVVIFYFAGHGMKGAFIPYDFDGINNVLYHSQVSDLIRSCKAKNKVCIADACHSGTLASRDIDAAGQTFTNYYNALTNSTGGLALIMSSQAEETSLEFGMLRQGAFSYFLIQGLKGEADADKNRIVTVSELFTYVKAKVEEATSNQQNPVISGKFDKNMPLGVVRQ